MSPTWASSFVPGLVPCYPRRPVPCRFGRWPRRSWPWRHHGGGDPLSRQRPYLLVGWLWYLGMLAPVIGLVQFGTHGEADRFTYLPQIGLTIALVWIAGDACRAQPRFRPIWAAAATGGLLILVVSAWRQTGYWHDSEALWTHTLACGPQYATAHSNLGLALAGGGRIDEAIAHFQKALEIEPDNAETHNNLGVIFARRGRIDEAIAHCQKALEIKPDNADAQNNLGIALAGCGRANKAIAHYQKALEIEPDSAEAHNNLAAVLVGRGRIDGAIEHYRKGWIRPAAKQPGSGRRIEGLAGFCWSRHSLSAAGQPSEP